MATTIAIIGGGLAGIAAAARLLETKAPDDRMVLLEARPRLGGRASSYEDRRTGALIDNCQHISLGCCVQFQELCETIGIAKLLRTEDCLTFLTPDGRSSRLSADRLPAPFHLARSLGGLHFLSVAEKISLARAVRKLAREQSQCEQPFSDWLKATRQSENLVRRFYEPVLISALSESLDRIRVSAARQVFVDAFLSTRTGWQMSIPRVPLNELHNRMADWLTARGVEIQTGTRVRSIEEYSASLAIELPHQTLLVDQVILAVPWHQVENVLSPALAGRLPIADLNAIEAAPISSVHLWFREPVTQLPHAVLLDTLSQWMFNRSLLLDADEHGQVLQVVISASREVESVDREEVIARVRSELERVFPRATAENLLRATLVTERRAVFSPTAENERRRPAQTTNISGLHLAGDWTRTGWPATMEGAVRSGNLAAQSVQQALGREANPSPPDPPAERVAKWIFRL